MQVFLAGLVIGGVIGAVGSAVYKRGKEIGFRNQAEELKQKVMEKAPELQQRGQAMMVITMNAASQGFQQAKDMAERTRSRFSGMQTPVLNGNRMEEAAPTG
jgi:hypothetical protein